MGVPKFFRWCAERYPTITRNIGVTPPPIDNLYLDVNGIIHNCTHPNDAADSLKRAPSEHDMIYEIFLYLERLFNAVQPRKHFMVAVDGVAPRAKMNQQRQRRYRAGYEMMMAREEAKVRGEEVPEETAVFDSNCITPGTPFMVLVSEKIKYFLAKKVSSDPAWQQCSVIYSGHDVPGEGEHKIAEFIRRRKMEKGYSPQETHCMYGLDADLVMLSLATHEPNFVLLREEVTFGNPTHQKANGRGGGGRTEVWKEDPRLMTSHTFVLLDIGLLRQYLALEMKELMAAAECAGIHHDHERFLDDFVFMCFFVGNDFLPSIPTVGINDDSIIEMLRIYIQEVRKPGEYLTKAGEIVWGAVERWLRPIGSMEFDVILTRQQNEEQYQRRRARMDGGSAGFEAPNSAEKTFCNIADYKQYFYGQKHHFDGYQPTGDDMRALKKHYIEGLTWVMHYYYHGPVSWKWYFPHFYAPMASDLFGLAGLAAEIDFGSSKPFLPHQQLLAVLPPVSYRCLPEPYWPLLRHPDSILADVFPSKIEIDREGARASWEGIVLIPFMQEEKLIEAYNSVQSQVSEKDHRCNVLGEPLVFSYDPKQSLTIKDTMFPPLSNLHVQVQTFTLPITPPFVPALCSGYDPATVVEGFGSLNTPHPFSVIFGKDAVKVFDMPSRRESVLIRMVASPELDMMSQLTQYLGQEVLVGYPYWRRARLEMLENETHKAYHNYQDNAVKMVENERAASVFVSNTKKHAAILLQRHGIRLDKIPVLAYVCLFTGMEENSSGMLRRQYSQSAVEYPVQLITPFSKFPLMEDLRFVERPRVINDRSVQQECCIVVRDRPAKADKRQTDFFGAVGHVISTEKSEVTLPGSSTKTKRVTYTVRVRIPENMPVPQSILDHNSAGNWKSSYEVSVLLGLKPNTVTILCGSCTTTARYGNRELGLPIKFDLQSLCRVGYAKLVHKLSNAERVTEYSRIAKDVPPEGHYLSARSRGNGTDCRRRDGIWLLSARAIQLMCDYIAAFPPVIRFIESTDGDFRNFDPIQFLQGEWADRDADSVVEEIEAFVKRSGLLEAPVMSSWEDAVSLPELQAFEEHLIAREAERSAAAPPSASGSPASTTKGTVLMKSVAAEHLFFPSSRSESGQVISFPIKPQKRSFIYRLGSRVVNCAATGGIPIGATGTIVRFFYARDAEVIYDHTYLGATKLGGRLKTDRGAVQRLHQLLPLNMPQQPTRERMCEELIQRFFQSHPDIAKRLKGTGGSPAMARARPIATQGEDRGAALGGRGGVAATAAAVAAIAPTATITSNIQSLPRPAGTPSATSPAILELAAKRPEASSRRITDFFPVAPQPQQQQPQARPAPPQPLQPYPTTPSSSELPVPSSRPQPRTGTENTSYLAAAAAVATTQTSPPSRTTATPQAFIPAQFLSAAKHRDAFSGGTFAASCGEEVEKAALNLLLQDAMKKK